MASELDPLSPLLLNGDAPDGWSRRRLSEIATISGGTTPSRAEDRYWGGLTAWATPTDLTSRPSGTLEIAKTADKLTGIAVEETGVRVLPVNSVLMTSRATIGEVAINRVPMATNQGFCNFIPKRDTDAIFLAYWLAGNKKRLERLAGGSTFLELAKRDAREVRIHLPPLTEQRTIAAILSSVDDAIAATQKVIEQTNRVKQGLLQTLTTRGIRHTRFKRTEIGEIPEAWEVARLAGLVETVMDFRGKTPRKLGMEWGGNIPALSAGNVRMGRVELDQKTHYGSEELYDTWMTHGDPQKGDVLFTMEAPLGNVAQIPDDRKYILSQRVVLLRFDGRRVTNDFMAVAMRGGGFGGRVWRRATGTTAKGVKWGALRNVKMPVPPMHEQIEIVSRVDALDRHIQSTEKGLARVRRMKRGLMQDLLTGRVRVQTD